ncbi:universal stress protein [Sediminibacterium ginsengisoli]|uniref:Nucleotide-binding universal stress protein, UspA family n=1 Tax=Sediminibacterium ginsengisoli TaxID=413434 RepID=A0A1T4PKR3_9BACT|nr:universal stress protein [Sediminibacterium ginsengisoli]SJZ91827.1 Nucleotide-binding universal stress protein, UspA family [Sediminibacterium ginsengisoli]
MVTGLKNILVPVNFTARNSWALQKATEMANTFHAHIHLVHVIRSRSSSIFWHNNTVAMQRATERLLALKDEYRPQICSKSNIEISVIEGNPAEALASYMQQYKMDLVVIGIPRFSIFHHLRSSFSIYNTVQRTGVPVLAVKHDGLVSHFKKIVVPMNDSDYALQVKLAAMLGKHFRSTIYLLSLRGSNGEPDHISIMQSMETIHKMAAIPVQTVTLEDANLASGTLRFSKKINADLILINPAREFILPGLWNRLTRKLLSYDSGIPVVTVPQIA